MTVEDAIIRACSDVGIIPPKAFAYGKWLKTDTLSGRNGKGDGRVIINEWSVTAHNWQTGQNATVKTRDGDDDPIQRRKIERALERQREDKERQKARSAKIAQAIVDTSESTTHPYLVGKGFPSEKALVIGADDVRRLAGDYLVPEKAKIAVVMPARIGARTTSVQLIWEDGTKKFLAGGEIGGSSYRIAKGADTWLCEGFATGLSLRSALRGLKRTDTILCCFSASNVAQVARSIKSRCFIIADNDKPLEQFGDVGTGEHYAKSAGKPFLMPTDVGADLNDMHMREGIFSVQKLIANFLRGARM